MSEPNAIVASDDERIEVEPLIEAALRLDDRWSVVELTFGQRRG